MSALLTLHAIPRPEGSVFHDSVTAALHELRQRLEQKYTAAYPQLAEIIHLVLAQEEARAWQLCPFPHLLFPDLVEAHIEKLNLCAQVSDHRPSAPATSHFAFALIEQLT